MSNKTAMNERLSSTIEIDYPDFTTLPERVKQKFEGLIKLLISPSLSFL
jgi:hypothetical protein